MIIEALRNRRDLVRKLEDAKKKSDSNKLIKVLLKNCKDGIELYPASVRKSSKGGIFAAGKFNLRKALFIIGDESLRVMQDYDGAIIHRQADFVIKKCRWTRSVARQVRSDFPQTSPAVSNGQRISISFGDVLGIAGRAQLQAFKGKAGLAFSRQCIHQMKKMGLHPEDTLDAVTWTVFQEGYEGGYVAEACHISTADDLRTMMNAGYTRFSVQPAVPTGFELREESKKRLLELMYEVPWIELNDKFELMYHRYKGRRLDLGTVRYLREDAERESETETEAELIIIQPAESEVLAAIAMFGRFIVQMVELDRLLVLEECRDDICIEVSFERYRDCLSPFDLYFLINEMSRRDVYVDFAAPGDITPAHWLVASHCNLKGLTCPVDSLPKIPVINPEPALHLVAEDIGYVTAVECAARHNPELFRLIWGTSRNHFEEAKRDVQTEIRIQHIPDVSGEPDDSLYDIVADAKVDGASQGAANGAGSGAGNGSASGAANGAASGAANGTARVEENGAVNDTATERSTGRSLAKEFLELTMYHVLNHRDEHGNRYIRKELFDYLHSNENLYTTELIKKYGRMAAEFEKKGGL